MNCQRLDPTLTCPICRAPPNYTPCPMADAEADTPLEGAPITAGTTGVCAIDNEECSSCQ